MRQVDTREFLDTLCALLAEGKRDLAVPVSGNSMRPFLQPGDTVYLSPLDRPLKKGDICLFRRSDGSYVLHRLIRRDAGGRLWMLGDNQCTLEPVPSERLCAVADSALRQGKPVSRSSLHWRFFAGPWRWLHPCRRLIALLRERLRR